MYTSHQAQMFTVFGGAYVVENHDPMAGSSKRAARSGAKWAVVAGALMLGITASAATNAIRTHENAWTKAPSLVTAAFEDALY
jgi:hypothetical protein